MPRRVLLAVLALALALLVAEGALSFRGGLTLRDVPGLAAWLPARAPAPRGSRRIVAAPSALATPATLPPGMPAPGMPAPGTLETPATPRDDLSADGDPPAEADLPALHEPATDADRHAAGAASTGIYRMHEDSRVRYVLKPETTVDIVETHVRTDRLGMRVRPGPEPPPEALRIAVAGDSVAFSYGVADDETMAARLAALLAESRGPAARPVTASTVAVPSWNHRSALGFLTDHWDELRPDIVVYLPIDNDL
ncbi:MAG TPA: hypothetical protein VK824_02245, partial [Planctomycetota bacterium]|nr:hypothetical protein [Planctomycetota bacterium]